MPKSCNGAGSYYIALSSSFQLPVRRQQSCTAIQLDDRLYTELDRPLGIRSLCVCVCVCHVVLVAAKAICPSSSEAHVGARVVCSFRSWITAPSTVLPKSYVVRRRAASPGRALQAAKPVLPPKSESG